MAGIKPSVPGATTNKWLSQSLTKGEVLSVILKNFIDEFGSVVCCCATG